MNPSLLDSTSHQNLKSILCPLARRTVIWITHRNGQHRKLRRVQGVWNCAKHDAILKVVAARHCLQPNLALC